MGESAGVRFSLMISTTFAVGALWGAAVAVTESILFNYSLGVGLQNPLSLLELVVNYALAVGIGWVVLRLILQVLFRPFKEPSGEERSCGDNRPRLAEALAGPGIFVAALAAFFQRAPDGSTGSSTTVTLGIVLGALVVFALLGLVVWRMSRRAVRILRITIALWVVIGFLWFPLLGPYNGLLRGIGEKDYKPSAKNVLLIVIDTLRPDYLGCYGGRDDASPNIDWLAVHGVVFENLLGQSTWTLPATASIVTGLYPSTHGAVTNGAHISSPDKTLAEVLNAAGYRTGAFAENQYIRPENGFGRGFDYFWTYWLPWAFDYTILYRIRARLKLPTIEFTLKQGYVTIPVISTPEKVNWDARVETDAGLEWLRKGGDKPFFAFFNYMGPHSPYGSREFLLDEPPPSQRLTDYPRPVGGAQPLGAPGRKATPKEIELMKTHYAADTRYVDYHVGRILEWLRVTGKLSETLIVITADHGEEFYEHGAWCHGSSAFNEVLQLPLVVYGAPAGAAGMRIDSTVRQIDLMPTVLDLIGLESPDGVQGRSVRALIDGEPLDPQAVFVEVYPVVPKECDINALVDGEYKVIAVSLGEKSTVLLYDLVNDPRETNNIAEVFPELTDSLLIKMLEWEEEAKRQCPVDFERLKYLRSLGYINQ